MSIDVTKFTNAAAAASQNVDTLAAAGKTDPASLLKMQQALADYQEKFGMASAIISDIKQTAMGIIQKM